MASISFYIQLALSYIIGIIVIHCFKRVSTDISCRTTDVWIPFEDEILHNVTTCDIQTCLDDCLCTLGNSTLTTKCIDGTEITQKIIFPGNVSKLYLGYVSLDAIDRFAFRGVGNRWAQLYLNSNNLTVLHSGIFDGLWNLEYLHLFRNNLSNLHLGVFSGLDSLVFVDLKYNFITKLHTGLFHGLSNIRDLKLGYNSLVELQSGVFEGLKSLQEIDVDDNLIKIVAADVFYGLYNLKEIDLDKNKISELPPDVFHGLSNLGELELDHNNLTKIPIDLFAGLKNIEELILSYNLLLEIDPSIIEDLNNLKELDLSYNYLTELHPRLFRNAPNLKTLYVEHNSIQTLHSNIFQNLTNLKALSLAQIKLVILPRQLLKDIHTLEFLNISGNNLKRLPSQVFKHLHILVTLDLTHNPLDWVSEDSFEQLTKRTIVYVDEYATCCFIESATCSFESPPSPFISCKRLLPYSILRVVVWIIAIGTITGNSFVLLTRFKQRNDNVQSLLITNLSLSDLLMGVYLIILISADFRYAEFFPSHSESWRQSNLCRLAGVLSMLSSEASVFIITLISIDRLMCIKYPFSTSRLRKKSASRVVCILWLLALFAGVSSILVASFFPDLYDVSEICVGFPISRVSSFNVTTSYFQLNISSAENDLNMGHAVKVEFVESKSSMFFSIAIFTALNFVCFLTVAFCYALIFVTAKKAARSGGNIDRDREIRRAFKMAAIVFTDFCCWMVVVVLSILVQSKTITIDPEAYAWIATFILPLNSCINPFLYTVSTYISDRFKRQVAPE